MPLLKSPDITAMQLCYEHVSEALPQCSLPSSAGAACCHELSSGAHVAKPFQCFILGQGVERHALDFRALVSD